jgi:hypothetical protein
MPIMLNPLLQEAGLDLKAVRLLRHQDSRAKRGRTPSELWRRDRNAFELYQCRQSIQRRARFKSATHWVSFVGTFQGETLFVGVYAAKFIGVGQHDVPMVQADGIDLAGTYDLYELQLQDTLSEFEGKLFVEWGKDKINWLSNAERRNLQIVELLRDLFKEPEFPGFVKFRKRLSEIADLPPTWVEPLRATKGIYLLTCPQTKQQYVGQACGESGFWGRWSDYVQTGHGGNVELKNRPLTDYQVSILEVFGSNIDPKEASVREHLWMAKLQSREMGLNH